MGSAARSLNNLYCLVLDADKVGEPRIFEFEAAGAQSALIAAARHCRGRKAEVFENGRSLCSITHDTADGFWIIAPTAAQTALQSQVRSVSGNIHAV